MSWRLSRVTWLWDLFCLLGESVWRKPWKQSTVTLSEELSNFHYLYFQIQKSGCYKWHCFSWLVRGVLWGVIVAPELQNAFTVLLVASGEPGRRDFHPAPKSCWTTLMHCPKITEDTSARNEAKMTAALKYAHIVALMPAPAPSRNSFITKALSKLQRPPADSQTAGKGCAADSFLCSQQMRKTDVLARTFPVCLGLKHRSSTSQGRKRNYIFVCK